MALRRPFHPTESIATSSQKSDSLAAPVKVNLTNGSQKPITIGIAGYELGLSPPTDPECLQSPLCAANQAALDQLNETAMPVPGQPGSPFIPLKVSKKPIAPGKSITLTLR